MELPFYAAFLARQFAVLKFIPESALEFPLSQTSHQPQNLNALRLILASCVIIGHSPELIDGDRYREPLTMLFGGLSLGEFAVRGFFVLSGMLIAGSWMRQPNLGRFLLKRVLRIYPAFVICSLLCLVLGYAVGGALPHWTFVVVQVAILASPQSAGAFAGTNYPLLNGAMWSIFFEFLCYLMIAGLGVFGLMRKWFVTVLFVVTAAAAIAVQWWNPPLHGVFMVYSSIFISLIPYFLAGSVLFFWAESLPSGRLPLPNLTWDISYGMYLYGWPTQKLLLWCWPKLEPWQLSPLALSVAGLLGLASWLLIERPFLALKKGRSH